MLPLDGQGLRGLSTRPDWYAQWRGRPEAQRHPVRTYTVRAVRPAAGELDLDFALHGDTGPASRWAATAGPGDAVAVLGPDAGCPGEHGGIEFRPPANQPTLLLAGDETATPAIMSILEGLPPDARGEVLLEVPCAQDELRAGDRYRDVPPAMRVSWLPRDGRLPGSGLIPAVTEALTRLAPAPTPMAAAVPTEPAVAAGTDEDILWEVPENAATVGMYAWLAGEAGVVKTLRRHLVTERGLDRRCVAFMGYWRQGRPELS